MPEKKAITLSELILISLVWSATQTVWNNIIRESVGSVFEKLGLGKYATNALTALFLLAAIMTMVLVFRNVNIGKSSVFMLTDDEPGIDLPFGKKTAPAPAPGPVEPPPGTFAPPEMFEPESMSLVQ